MTDHPSTMRRPVVMPTVEVGMTTGRLVAFLVDVGTTVSVGQPLFTVEGDKVTVDIEAPVAGRVVQFIAEPDTEMPVGAEVLALEVPK